MKLFSSILISILMTALVWASPARADGIPQERPLSGVVLEVPSGEAYQAFNIIDDVRLFSNIGANIRANQDASGENQNETTIISNPINPFNLVGGSNDYRNGEVDGGFYYTFDGGQTWGDGTLCCWPDLDAQGDPAVTCDAEGNFYFAVISFDRGSPDNGIYVSKSTDGGVNWGNPVAVIEHLGEPDADFEDKEYITADITDSPYRNNVYISWTSFGTDYPIKFSRSTNGGQSFSSPIVISDYNYNQGSVPAVGPNGEVYVVWFAYDSPEYIRFDKSTDGGLTFGTDVDISQATPLPSPLPPTSFRVNSFPSIAVDISDGPYSGYIHVVWADYRNGDADIYYSRSTNGGTSWSAAARLNDDPIGNDADQFFQWISCDPHGNVHVFFYDRRDDPSNILFDGYYTRSDDGGATWSTNERVTTVSSDPADGNPNFIGDYNGITSVPHKAYPLWTDTRLGEQDSYVSRIDWGSMPLVDIAMDPDDNDIVIPAGGGTFTFTGILGNNYNFPINGDVWIMLTLPGGGSYGPLNVFSNIPLNGMEVLYYPGSSQIVPGYAIPGEYTYWAYAGLYPSYITDSAGFKFTKLGASPESPLNSWETNGFPSSDQSADNMIAEIYSECYPNPFNSSTNIQYFIHNDSKVKLEVFNLAGQKVSMLVDRFQNAGVYSIKWDAVNFSSGVYFYKLSANGENFTKRLVLLK
ncbi:MAG: T9SS type A sorting domain-containing protein [candidate division Zixibacteria bacterium]|nr:T9SS type A sorting domain-containing protein [candidate division Zixibacteria bacterium]